MTKHYTATFTRIEENGITETYTRFRFTQFLLVNYGKRQMMKVLAEFDNGERTFFRYNYGYFTSND
jgi:hypothetical protein